MCGAVLLLPTAAIAVTAPAFPFCRAGHAFISQGASGGPICDYSAGRMAYEVIRRGSLPGNIATSWLEFNGCPSRSKLLLTAAHPIKISNTHIESK